MNIDIYFDKLYKYERKAEPCFIGIPLKKGELYDLERVAVLQDGKAIPLQKKVTARHDDGSVRFMFLRFLADLPADKGAVLECDTSARTGKEPEFFEIAVQQEQNVIKADTGVISFAVENGSDSIFQYIEAEGRRYEKRQLAGPVLCGGEGKQYRMKIGKWNVAESGAVCTILKAQGTNICDEDNAEQIDFEVKLTAYAKKPWIEVSYRIINTTSGQFTIASLVFDVKLQNNNGNGQEMTQVSEIRTCAASSNYKTDFLIGENGETVSKCVDAESLVYESNEHFAEVFYGTFFADCTDEESGVCATIFQAQQNYPKAVRASSEGVSVMLVPEAAPESGGGSVVMESGMSREQKFLLHFHSAGETLEELDNRSLIYQMPDRPYVQPDVHKNSGCYPDIFTDKFIPEAEQALIEKADSHARAYGMLNFGDSPDMNYTTQGRGGGDLVWSNNEYDFPHACALLYVRNATRRFLDYNIAAASHWMDVDVCHFSDNPLFLGGQWEHTNGHCRGNVRPREKLMVCSHQWVEGLLDYYHFTGDERGLETAVGIGGNVLRLLETPVYAQIGEVNARETGWALRSLTALYVETNDKKWLAKADKIIQDFKVWGEQYGGGWLAPYTDNTVIRTGFMISIAVGSLMRYYRVFPSEELKNMMINAVDDLIKNCYMERTGLFYYKELPSLSRLGTNTLLLESLVAAYELTGDAAYLKYGVQTFKRALREQTGSYLGKKTIYGDAVVAGSGSPKNFGQCFIPIAAYYRAVMENGGMEIL